MDKHNGRAPAQLPTNSYELMEGEIYRRTTTGFGRTKKPGLQGTVKNPRLLKAFMITSVISDMSEFFDIFSSKSISKQPIPIADANKTNKIY